MKKIIFIFIFFYNFSFGQEFKVLNKKTQTPIPEVNVDFLDGNGTFTDEKGVFIIPLKTQIDSIRISSVGFKTKKISLKDLKNHLTVLLEEDISTLEEVLITSTTVELLEHEKPFSTHRLLNSRIVEFRSGEIGVTYIPFPDNIEKGKVVIIKKIVVNTDSHTSKERGYYPFKVNLYSADSLYFPPKLKDSLMTGIITSRKKGEPKQVVIDIEDYDLRLGEDGIFVSFETLPDKYYPNGTGIDPAHKTPKRLDKKGYVYAGYGAQIRSIGVNPQKTKVYSYSLDKNIKLMFVDDNIEDYWQMKKDFIYDLTIEIEY